MGEATELIFLSDTYKFESTANILSTGSDPKGNFVVLDKTIFYPQSGGQPSDTGLIQLDDSSSLTVTFVAFNGEIVNHYVKEETLNETALKGKSVTLKLDQERRLLNAKSHSAGHLMGDIVEKLAPELVGVKGFHFPEGPNVEFTGKLTSFTSEELMQKVNDIMKADIFEGKAVKAEGVKNRIVSVGDYKGCPCGGTHLKNVNELKEVTVKKIKFKSGVTKISYTFL